MNPGPRPRRAFSLVELIVVLAVAVVLTGFLLPAMANLRENAFRVVCASNERQIGVGVAMFGNDNDRMPYSYWVDRKVLGANLAPWELMSSRHAFGEGALGGWDGLGILFGWGYCASPDCFYCPSHHGSHPIDRYRSEWEHDGKSIRTGGTIYMNYHYSGHASWRNGEPRRLDGDKLVVVTDGLRTRSDFNHRTGMNVLRGDGSVRWNQQVHSVFSQLPVGIDEDDPVEGYDGIWEIVGKLR